MSQSNSILFAPLRVKNVIIPNRFMCSAVHMADSDSNGFPSDHLLNHYKDLASGMVGLIVPGYTYLMDSGKALPKQTGMSTDEHAEAWRETIKEIHNRGSRIVIQVCHGGLMTSRFISGSTPAGPSRTGFFGRTMTVSDIEDVVDQYRRAAVRLKKVGADGIMLHAAHGYLISEFLSPIMNKRTDKYGGSLENRSRLLREIVEEVSKVTTPEFILAMKINGSDCQAGGCTSDDVAKVVASLPKMDLTEVSCGIGSSGTAMRGFYNPKRSGLGFADRLAMRILKSTMDNPEYPFSEGYNLEYAKAIKRAAPHTVVSSVGGFRSFDVMEKAVQSGATDLISLGRPLLREPFLVRDFYDGKTDHSSCASCGLCTVGMMSRPPARCYLKELQKKKV